MTRKFLPLLLLLLLVSCAGNKTPKHELRGAWIATVVNIDWPKNGNDHLEKKKQDFLEILDFYESLNFNAVVVQVRTAGDAFYPTEMAPWSAYLTGTQGKASDPYRDLLEWMINTTHDRGMEFHAWMNPYRATFNLDTAALASTHDFNKHPEWMIKYGKKYYYDPALSEVQDHLTAITNELVENYNIDAIHFDDYFYPYKIKGEVFQDSARYATHHLSGQSLGDWRRANVDSLISKLHHGIKSRKPWVQFGISPFGVWRNKSQDPRGSETKAGQTNYDDLYADPMSWLRNGWIDYLAPQIYWTLNHPLASHKTILTWWDQNTENANLYVGNGAYRAMSDKDPDWQKEDQLLKQVKLARKAEHVNGNIYFSAKSLMSGKDEVVSLLKEAYKYKALTPPQPSSGRPPVVEKIIQQKTIGTNGSIDIKITSSSPVKEIVIYDLDKIQPNKMNKARHIKTIIPRFAQQRETVFTVPVKKQKSLIFSVTDRFGNESELQSISL